MGKPIHKAISDVLRAAQQSLLPQEIYERIVADGLCSFQAQNPLRVVKSQLRRHCIELDFPSARKVKYFTMNDDGRFSLLSKPVKVKSTLYEVDEGGKKKRSGGLVTVPPADEETEPTQKASDQPSHTEIQGRLLELGSATGLSVWAPMNDRGRSYNSQRHSDTPRRLKKLPRPFV